MADKRDCKIAVLRKRVDEAAAREAVEANKAKAFRSFLAKPKKKDVHVHSMDLYYEPILVVSGRYYADYYRSATHVISVDSDVMEVVFGDDVFQARTKSRLEKTFAVRRGKNKIDLPLEEHVFVRREDRMAFDHHGRAIKIPFDMGSEDVEHRPKALLSRNESKVRRHEITPDEAAAKLLDAIKLRPDPGARDVSEKFSLREVTELYVPVFEAVLAGPKRKAGKMRLDAVRNKIL